ncbi:MAG: hypothetical protein ACK4K0_11495 [Flavobacteriales bacterium]
MDIFLTFDYELFFGKQSGTAENCLLKPSDALVKIADKHQIRLVFFIDIGYVVQLEKFKAQFPELEDDYNRVVTQIKKFSEEGHDCQLHVHPHWEDTVYADRNWNMNTKRYKLTDFHEEAAHQLFSKYKNKLEEITGKTVNIYRAGGWCIQPFSHIKQAFSDNGILLDSSAFYGGKNTTPPYYYDYTKLPKKSSFRFSNKLIKPEKQGDFYELPIAAYYYNSLFFWKLFILGRLFPGTHKPIGDGFPVMPPRLKKQYLTKGLFGAATCDAYFAGVLERAFAHHQKTIEGKEFVVIGHPKACTVYSLKKLDNFIAKNKHLHHFSTFSYYLKERD